VNDKVLKQIQSLRERLEELKQKEALNDPYFEVEPQSILKDECTVYYYQNGTGSQPTVFDGLPFATVIEWAFANCGENLIYLHMGCCTEWMMLRTQNDFKYTDEQRARSKERWISMCPELAKFDTDPEVKRMGQYIAKIPQTGVFINGQLSKL
jgi:hypothetical protein